MPGTIRTFSTPRRTRGAHTTSSSWTARKSVHSGTEPSIRRAADLVAAGRAAALVSAGNTGATVIAAHAVNATLYAGKLPYDSVKSFMPVSLVGVAPHRGLQLRARTAPSQIHANRL